MNAQSHAPSLKKAVKCDPAPMANISCTCRYWDSCTIDVWVAMAVGIPAAAAPGAHAPTQLENTDAPSVAPPGTEYGAQFSVTATAPEATAQVPLVPAPAVGTGRGRDHTLPAWMTGALLAARAQMHTCV